MQQNLPQSCEVLELMSMGDLPEEVKAARRAKMQKSRMAAEQRERKRMAKMEKAAMECGRVEGGADFEQLNGVKRDRRTVEEIQHDMLMQESNRAKKMKREEGA